MPRSVCVGLTPPQFERVQWDVASVDEGALGFESVGIVAATAGVLDQAQVPILYLSTRQLLLRRMLFVTV